MRSGEKSNIKENSFAAVIRITGFRTLWFGQVCTQLAISSLLFVLALLVYERAGNNTAVSILFLLYALPALFLGMIAGTIVDKLDARFVLLTSDGVRALLVLGLFFFSHNLTLLYILTFFNALISQFYIPAAAPTIPRFVPPKLLVAANSLFSFTYFTSLAIGSLVAGPLIRFFGSWVFLCISALFLLAVYFDSKIPSQKIQSDILLRIPKFSPFYIVQKIYAHLSQVLAYLRHQKVLKDALLLLAGTQIILALLGTLGPGFADRMLEVDIRDASLLITGPAVLGLVIGALIVGQGAIKLDSDTLIRRGIVAVGVLLLCIAGIVRLKHMALGWFFLSDIWLLPMIIILFFFLGVANSFLDVPANSILQSATEGDMRGRIYGILTSVVGGAGILPVVLGGVLADSIGVGKVIFFLGIAVLGYSVVRRSHNFV